MDDLFMDVEDVLMEEEEPVLDVTDSAPISCVENELEWLRGQTVIAGTLCRGRFANKVRRLAKAHPEEVQILAENADGSIFFHIPLSYLHIYAPSKREMTEQQKEEARIRLAQSRKQK